MAGTAGNVRFWGNADVYIDPTGALAAPTDLTTAWAAGWEPVGLLDGEEGFTEERDQESEDHYAWGGLLIRTTRSQHKRTIRFVALEDNDTVFQLVNPGSTREPDGLDPTITVATVKVPVTSTFSIGFEKRDGLTVARRVVRTAEVSEVAEIQATENNPTVYDITTVLYPESDGTLYTEISGQIA